MWDFLHTLGEDPLYYVGTIVSALAVLSFLVFLRGFIAGAGYVYGNNGHAEHQKHAMARVTWGTFLLFALFVIWECIRFVASWFGVGAMAVGTGWTFLAIFGAWFLYALLFKKAGGH